MYSSTCFGRPHAHHQELNNCSSSLWFYRWSVVVDLYLHDPTYLFTLHTLRSIFCSSSMYDKYYDSYNWLQIVLLKI